MTATRSATAMPVGLVEQLQPRPVAALLPRALDQLVERLVREAALVRPAVRLEQQPEEVLGVGVARQPPRHVDADDVGRAWPPRASARRPRTHLEPRPSTSRHDCPTRRPAAGRPRVEARDRELDRPDARPLEVRAGARRDRSGSAMSGVWPWSAGGTTPPGGDDDVLRHRRGRARRGRSACASARRSSRLRRRRVAVVERDVRRTRRPRRGCASGATSGTRSASRGVYRTTPCRARPRP